MINVKELLTVKHEASLAFVDYSHKTNNFGRDVVSIELDSSDFLYVGFRKPINAFYFNHTSTYENEAVLSLEVYNGTSWVEASGKADDTLGLKRSGFIKFDRDQVGQVSHTVDGSNLYWYRLSVSEAREELKIEGINLVFADDYELMLEQPYITLPEFLGKIATTTHILIHAACRNEIMQCFRNKDYYKMSNGVKEDINAWDLLDIEEIRQAAVYLAMSKIYFNMSDANDDVWANKSYEYRTLYTKMIQVASLSLDVNDDGVVTSNENKPPKINSTFMSR
jgi:hypothetical protein